MQDRHLKLGAWTAETQFLRRRGGGRATEGRTRAPIPLPTAATLLTPSKTTATEAGHPTNTKEQKADTPLRDTTALGVARHTGVSLPLRDDTPLGRRGRSPAAGACGRGAAPGAAHTPRPALPPGAEGPARTSPHTDRITPGRGTVRTAPTQTAEHDAAHGATHPFAKGDETRPVSWKHAGSPVLVRGPSRTTGPARPRRAPPAARPAAAAVAATAAAAAAGATAGAGVAAAVAHARTTATTATAATKARASEDGRRGDTRNALNCGAEESTRTSMLTRTRIKKADALLISRNWLSLFMC